MVTRTLLLSVLGLEAVVLVIAIVVLFGHAIALRSRERRLGPPMERGRHLLRMTIGEGPSDSVIAEVKSLKRSVQVDLFEEISPNLTGQDRLHLMRLAEGVGLVQLAESACRHRKWQKRLRGARMLTLLGGGKDVVPDLLDDHVTEVRAQAAEWAAWYPHPETIAKLLRMLGDERSLCRFTVQDSLLRLGGAAAPQLKAYLQDPGVPNPVPALKVAARLRDGRFLRAALDASTQGDPAVRAAAAEVLGSIGGPEATFALSSMLSDPSQEVRAAAVRSLGDLNHWPAAATLAPLLGDLAFTVRQETGRALKKMGAPGVLLLRKARSSTDRFARDTARQVLDVPDAIGSFSGGAPTR